MTFFRSSLDQMIESRHLLAVLANSMPWQETEASLPQRWARQVKADKKIEDLDLFGPVSAVASGGVTIAVCPRLPTSLMVVLLYLKHAFSESDEHVIQRWGELPTWQYFSNTSSINGRAIQPYLGVSVKVWAKKAWKNCWSVLWKWRLRSS